MTTETDTRIDWRRWRERWEDQQSAYTRDWEGRFTAMLDVLQVLLPEDFLALDLASGPGTISRRILERFPRARCIAVDLDPVLLTIGRETLGDAGGRLRWVDADLKSAAWLDALGEQRVDAVLSTTALHWLPAESLIRLYRELGGLIREGGLFLNGDNMAFSPELPSFIRMRDWKKETFWSAESITARGHESWAGWWEDLKGEPDVAELIAERERRFGDRVLDQPIYDVHVAALRDAGFREVGTIWQQIDNRVLMAVR